MLDLIKKNEGKLSIVQIFGFILITTGVIYFASFLLPNGVINWLSFLALDEHPDGREIALAFFTTMLGIVFAFPEMVQGQTKDVSTMRIIVFMFANVICMLLLKIGWDKNSLTEIGIDGFWVGVIALLFGAKATQSYFENAKSFMTRNAGEEGTTLNEVEISRLAVIQNRDELLAKHPNIESISDTLRKGEPCVTIYLKDSRTEGIPSQLNGLLKNGTKITVPTEIVTEMGVAEPHISQKTDQLSDSETFDYIGSICCIVESATNQNFKGLVTAGHIFTFGDFFNYGGVLGPGQQRDFFLNNDRAGRLFFQQMKFNQDLAIVKVTEPSDLLTDYTSFKGGFYSVSEKDYSSTTPNVTVLSKVSGERDAFVLDSNVSLEIQYFNFPRFIRNIILIGSTSDRTTSKTVSTGGDSGGCVYHKSTKKLIGILLGGNNRFSFVLPIEETLRSFNFKPI